jgi:hypothetical protein
VNSWKVILATMVIFGTGVLTGGLLVKNAMGPNRLRNPRNVAIAATNNQPNLAPMQLQRMDFLLRVRNELNLSPEQHTRIEQIIRDGQERSRKLWEGVAPQMREELKSVHEKIRAELTPEQRRRFEQLLRNVPRQNQTEGLQPNPGPERFRDRLRQGERPADGTMRPPRREGPPAGPRPEAEPEFAPGENLPPANAPAQPQESPR